MSQSSRLINVDRTNVLAKRCIRATAIVKVGGVSEHSSSADAGRDERGLDVAHNDFAVEECENQKTKFGLVRRSIAQGCDETHASFFNPHTFQRDTKNDFLDSAACDVVEKLAFYRNFIGRLYNNIMNLIPSSLLDTSLEAGPVSIDGPAALRLRSVAGRYATQEHPKQSI